jgi:hypothetical protein
MRSGRSRIVEERRKMKARTRFVLYKTLSQLLFILNSQVQLPATADTSKAVTLEGPDPTDPLHTTPLPRYNAVLPVLRNTLYM